MVRVSSFDLEEGTVLAGKYVVKAKLGKGWEGEVYRVVERGTGVRRAFKLFFPQRNRRDATLRRYAKKLDKLRRCELVIQYHHTETIEHEGIPIRCLVSELVDGPVLAEWRAHKPNGRLETFEALHLTYALVRGLEEIHLSREYHGDLHDLNVVVEREGIFFRPKVFDFFHRGELRREHLQGDVIDVVRLLYDAVGGRERYAMQPAPIKTICCGLRNDLVRRRFPTASHLRRYLESFRWEE